MSYFIPASPQFCLLPCKSLLWNTLIQSNSDFDHPWPKLSQFLLLIFFFLSLSCSEISAQQPPSPTDTTPTSSVNPEQLLKQELGIRLNELKDIILQQQEELQGLQKQLSGISNEVQLKSVLTQLSETEKSLRSSKLAFESIVTGGVDPENFANVPNESFDWQADLLEILQPMFQGLKDLTEKPRLMERLRNGIQFYEQQLQEIKTSIVKIDEWDQVNVEEDTRQRIRSVRQVWEERRGEAQRNLDLVRLQLESLQQRQESFWNSAWDGLGTFLTGRGFNLFLAILATLLVWLGMKVLLRGILPKSNADEVAVRSQYSRVLLYAYRVISVAGALLAFLLVLYITGDWLLLGMALLVLAGVAVGLKNYIPRFLAEGRLILNLGAVREGERVIYEGVPWMVQSINFYSQLVNPHLQGGQLRLPLAEISELISRPLAEGEPWFPSKIGDFVMLSDGSFGQITVQTPEVVQLQVRSARRTYPVEEYLRLSPHNISCGTFVRTAQFGIADQHRDLALDSIPQKLRTAIEDTLAQSEFALWVEEVSVELDDVGASSLFFLLHVKLASEAASGYWRIGRLMKQACVRICISEGWTLSNPQLTVHLPKTVLPQK